MAETGNRRITASVPSQLWEAFGNALAGSGHSPSEALSGFIDWWTGEGAPAPMRPDLPVSITDWTSRTSATLRLPSEQWDRFGRAAEASGFTRNELVIRFARWYVGRETLPPRP